MAAPRIVFAEPEKKFSWDPKIAKWLLADNGLGAKSADDFLHMAASEQGNEFEAVVKAAGCSNALQQVSRLRQAWTSVRHAASAADEVKKRGRDESDLDALLDQAALDNLQDEFFARYKMSYLPEVDPSEALISRLSKEMSKRILTHKDVFKTRSRAHQE